MIVAVTGATGWIGREVCSRLRKHGADVRPLDRFRNLDGVGILDLMVEEADPSWGEALRGCDAVVHCAGHVHRPVENEQERRLFKGTNVDGMRKLLMAAKATGVERLVFVSTSALYDWSAGSPMLETGTLRPTTAYGASKLEAEELVRASGLDWRIARLGTVFGAGDRANFSKLAGALRRRRFVIPGLGAARKSVIPIELAAAALAQLALSEEPKHRLLNVALPDAPTLRELCDSFSEMCGFARARSAPLGMLRFGAMAGNLLARVRPGFPLTSAILAKLTTSTVVNPKRLYETFPDFPRPTFTEALEPAVEYYRSV